MTHLLDLYLFHGSRCLTHKSSNAISIQTKQSKTNGKNENFNSSKEMRGRGKGTKLSGFKDDYEGLVQLFQSMERFFFWFVICMNDSSLNAYLRDATLIRIASIMDYHLKSSSLPFSSKSMEHLENAGSSREEVWNESMNKLRLLGKLFGMITLSPYCKAQADVALMKGGQGSISLVEAFMTSPLRHAIESAYQSRCLSLTLPWILGVIDVAVYAHEAIFQLYLKLIGLLRSILLSEEFSMLSIPTNYQLSRNRLYIIMQLEDLFDRVQDTRRFSWDLQSISVLSLTIASKATEIDLEDLSLSRSFFHTFISTINDKSIQLSSGNIASRKKTSMKTKTNKSSSPFKSKSSTESSTPITEVVVRSVRGSTPTTATRTQSGESGEDDDLVKTEMAFWQLHPSLQQVHIFLIQHFFQSRMAQIKDFVAQAVRALWMIHGDYISLEYSSRHEGRQSKSHPSVHLQDRSRDVFAQSMTDIDRVITESSSAPFIDHIFALYPSDSRVIALARHFTLAELRNQNRDLSSHAAQYLRRKLDEVIKLSEKQNLRSTVDHRKHEEEASTTETHDSIPTNDVKGREEIIRNISLIMNKLSGSSTPLMVPENGNAVFSFFQQRVSDRLKMIILQTDSALSRNQLVGIMQDLVNLGSLISSFIARYRDGDECRQNLLIPARVFIYFLHELSRFYSLAVSTMRDFCSIEVCKFLQQILPHCFMAASSLTMPMEEIAAAVNQLVVQGVTSHGSLFGVFTILGRKSSRAVMEAIYAFPDGQSILRSQFIAMMRCFLLLQASYFQLDDNDLQLLSSDGWIANQGLCNKLKRCTDGDFGSIIVSLGIR